jgi:deoxyribodipyrimidine photolyase-related protein
LLTPLEVVSESLEFANRNEIPMNSLEGFVRQIIGWREFIRGVDREYARSGAHRQNHLAATRKLKPCWYEGTTGLPPLDIVIRRVVDTGYCHHIERLMVVEMFIDSAEWVMRPNVYGMSQFADGGLFATKPYISGSNYILKMSDYPKGDWCETWDGLYWRTIHRHRDLFGKNPRMSMMLASLERMPSDKKMNLFAKAERFIDLVTEPG